LCDNYDKEHRLVPADPALRARTLVFVHAAEGTLMVHAMALRYFRTHAPAPADPAALAAADAKLAAHVVADLDWLARELERSGGAFLVGDALSAADVMLAPCVQIVLRVGALGRSWPGIDAWLRRCEATAGYKRMVERTGYAEGG
jgi:glutathione S-transferase